ncbi:hypothetical protein ACFE04_022302 [Oxalis oulophora]
MNNNFLFFTFIIFLIPSTLLSLNTDGILLLSFKYSILSDPLSVLENWNYDDATPCSWTGVSCNQLGSPNIPRVTSLILSNNKLLGSISTDLGLIENLQILDLSNNLFDGYLPSSILNSTELQSLSLASNKISGELPETIGEIKSLQLLNLTDNAFSGEIPKSLTTLQNLTVVSLRSNYFSGNIPSEVQSIQVLDLSSNLLNNSLPLDFGGSHLRYLNLSYNKISGSIAPEFSDSIPINATLDLSNNELSGAIPESKPLLGQEASSFSGNLDLCGKPLKKLCSIPSTLSTPPNATSVSPAIAVIPNTVGSNQRPSIPNSPQDANQSQNSGVKVKPGTIAIIIIADLAGLALLAIISLYVYQLKKRKQLESSGNLSKHKTEPVFTKAADHLEYKKPPASWSCLTISAAAGDSSEGITTTSSDSDDQDDHKTDHQTTTTKLVTIDGETELELETLLKASAYILGSTESSIVYKAVVEDGRGFAVRRIGAESCCVSKVKDFETQVRFIGKLKHQNLVKVRGFYWGDDEKLVIYDYVDNGCLSNFTCSKAGSSRNYLPLKTRLKIARGTASGVAYIHEKKYVHGNLKPSNILLTSNMEPIIADFGLDRLILSNNLGNQRTTPIGSLDFTTPTSPYHTLSVASSSSATTSHYQAPESRKNVRPHSKWDVYSFGIITLELFTGRMFTDREMTQWTGMTGSIGEEEKKRVLMRMIDPLMRGDVEGREEEMLAIYQLGLSCTSFMAQKRPSMKDALQILEKISSW